MDGTVDYALANGVAWLTVNHVRRLNALNLAMWRAIPALVARALADREVRVIALRGAGGKAFSAGADISRFASERHGAVAVRAYDEAVALAEEAVAQAGKPTLALVEGICFGGGLGLASACDLRLANASARFCVPAARLGIGYAPRGLARLARLIGPSATAEVFFTARVYAAGEALRLGLVNQVFDDAGFASLAAAVLQGIAANAPLTLAAAKSALLELARPDVQQDFSVTEALVAACYDSADYAEGQAAFAAKRAPGFHGQ